MKQPSPIKIFWFGVLLLTAVFTYHQLRAAQDASLPISVPGILKEVKERLTELIDLSSGEF